MGRCPCHSYHSSPSSHTIYFTIQPRPSQTNQAHSYLWASPFMLGQKTKSPFSRPSSIWRTSEAAQKRLYMVRG